MCVDRHELGLTLNHLHPSMLVFSSLKFCLEALTFCLEASEPWSWNFIQFFLKQFHSLSKLILLCLVSWSICSELRPTLHCTTAVSHVRCDEKKITCQFLACQKTKQGKALHTCILDKKQILK